eukprot:1267705-Pleurochrysis_carterae.AAC.1
MSVRTLSVAENVFAWKTLWIEAGFVRSTWRGTSSRHCGRPTCAGARSAADRGDGGARSVRGGCEIRAKLGEETRAGEEVVGTGVGARGAKGCGSEVESGRGEANKRARQAVTSTENDGRGGSGEMKSRKRAKVRGREVERG